MCGKKIFFVLLFFIGLQSLYAEKSDHERIGREKEKIITIELDSSCNMQFFTSSGYNVYTISPQVGFNFIVLNDYIFTINQPFTIRLNDIDSRYEASKQNGLKFAVDDIGLNFTWRKPYKSWRFNVGTDMTIPTAPYKAKNETHFVSGTGRFSQSLLFSVSYISDPVIIGGNIVYTFVTPQIKNDKTAWIPCILTTGLNITTVLNNYFSVSISGNISWNSNELFQKQYQHGQSSVAETIQFQASWQKEKWALVTAISITHNEQALHPKWTLGYTYKLFEK